MINHRIVKTKTLHAGISILQVPNIFAFVKKKKKMVFNPFSPYTQALPSFLQRSIPSVLTILLLLLFRYAYLDYQGWYALGAGGIPHNVFGWLAQSLLRLRASRNVRDSGCYDAAIRNNELERTSFLKDQLPAWTGKAPKTAVWVAPHRQLEQTASAEIKRVSTFTLIRCIYDTIARIFRDLTPCRV